MNREAIAWAAGLFEGEGSVLCAHKAPETTGRSGAHQLRASIHGVDREPLDTFAAVVAFGPVHGPYRHGAGRATWQSFHTWEGAGHQRVQALAAMLWPWLSERRRGQFIASLTCYRTNSVARRLHFQSEDARRESRREWDRQHRPSRYREVAS